uniref:TGF-beta family profile domain-containing protein n=1 Tax=Meloidogyne enterolobii TaxID=390850 RepID=A0A6V7W812_MELEN|nr:unnamed protein product [Meloidogyne enterolobii]
MSSTRLDQLYTINDSFVNIFIPKSILAALRWVKRWILLMTSAVHQLLSWKKRRRFVKANIGCANRRPKEDSFNSISIFSLLISRLGNYCCPKYCFYSQDCSIQLSCFYLFLIFCFTLPSVLSFDASNKVITTPTFTLEERALLRKTFLNKFGLSHLNNLKKQENSTPKVPKYVWNLYRRLQQRKADFTTIRHFSTYSLEFVGNGYAKLVFNLSMGGKQFENEVISHGELRLPNWKEGSIRVRINKHGDTSKNGTNETPDFNSGIGLERRPWIDLDGKLLTTSCHNQKLNLLLHFPSNIPINNVEYMLRAAALLIYANDKGSDFASKFNKNDSKHLKQRFKRSLRSGATDENSKFEEEEDASLNTSRQKRRRLAAQQHRHRQHNSGSGACRRADLYVDFGQLNWQDWIVAPCRCSHPLPSHLNSSNHAIMQSLLHSIDPGAALAPSCVPVQMSSITILYRDTNNNALVVKAYADMRVDACGCQ